MASAREVLPLASVAAGEKFSAFILGKFGKSVAYQPSSSAAFSLLVAFGRCRFHLDEAFVARSLSAILGGPANSFQVCLIEDRIFLFPVSCKEVGFEIYKIRRFVCVNFELAFNLLNESGLSFARSFTSNLSVFPWMEVQRKSSYAEIASKPAEVLTGANKIPVRQQLNDRRMFFANNRRKSVFDRIIFPRTSVFERLSWKAPSSGKQPSLVKQSQPFRSKQQTALQN